jgi:hypothetical protein
MIHEIKTEAGIVDLQFDNFDNIKEAVDSRQPFHIMAYYADDGDEEDEKKLGIWLEPNYSPDKDATIMFEMNKENALYFAKSLLAMAKAI